METFSALLALCAGNSPVTGEVPLQRRVMRSFDVLVICTWINGWVNNREAGDLRRHRAHYDITVMWLWNDIRRSVQTHQYSPFNLLCHIPQANTFNSSPLSGCMCPSLGWVIIGSDNGLSPVQRQVIIETNDDFSSITPRGTDFSEKNDRN